MSKKTLVKDYLEQEVLFRERKNKDRGIVNLLIKKYGLQYAIDRGEITKDKIVTLVQDYATMDRSWRQILQKNENLRGSDYDEKDQLESKKMVELGYRQPKNIGPTEIIHPQPTLL